jgi:hypothetical protein
MEGSKMKRIPILLLSAMLIVGLIPVAASAQATDAEEAAAIALWTEALDGLETSVGIDGRVDALVEVEAALVVMKEVFFCLSFVGIDKAIEDLAAALIVGDLELIDLAVAVVLVEGLELIDMAIGSDCGVPATTTTIATSTTIAATTTIAVVETDIPEGGSGPNAALLGMSALLVLLAGGAVALRASADRR